MLPRRPIKSRHTSMETRQKTTCIKGDRHVSLETLQRPTYFKEDRLLPWRPFRNSTVVDMHLWRPIRNRYALRGTDMLPWKSYKSKKIDAKARNFAVDFVLQWGRNLFRINVVFL